jgi:hypothetical protein
VFPPVFEDEPALPPELSLPPAPFEAESVEEQAKDTRATTRAIRVLRMVEEQGYTANGTEGGGSFLLRRAVVAEVYFR